jgi:murein DD-endopeptidase MepM/ murein hydrolase activator NlpD
MAQSVGSPTSLAPTPFDERTPFQAVIEGLSATFNDLPRVARMVGHLTLALLMLLVIGNILPRDPQPLALDEFAALPSAASQAAGASVQNRPYEARPYWTMEENARYLESSAVPLTMRVMREILPLTAPKESSVRTTVLTYRVQGGDTALGIAEKFGLKGNSLLWANDSLDNNPDSLAVGQELNILPVDGAYHTVAKGETLEKIASTYKVDPAVITSFPANVLQPPVTLAAGQKLIIPGGTKPYVAPQVLAAYEGPVPQGARKGSGNFVWPMSGSITQRPWAGHMAVDLGAPIGTPVVAADAGFVAVVQRSTVSYGRMVIIDHGNGYQTRYAHLNVIYVEVGQSVARGAPVGACGMTGNATGPHLHFEIMRNGVALNPLNYLP